MTSCRYSPPQKTHDTGPNPDSHNFMSQSYAMVSPIANPSFISSALVELSISLNPVVVVLGFSILSLVSLLVFLIILA